MNNIKAFPLTNKNLEMKYQGMDLRDYFAGRVLQSLIANNNYPVYLTDDDVIEDAKGDWYRNSVTGRYAFGYGATDGKRYRLMTSHEERIARESYKIADAMLKAREINNG